MTGERYIESLRDGREVWLDGKRVDDITTHPAFRDMVHALADVYDLQNTEYRDEMTYWTPRAACAPACPGWSRAARRIRNASGATASCGTC